MAKTMSVKEAATLWGLTERRVSALCKDGKIKGAKKNGLKWMIPANAAKPTDNRIKSGAYKKQSRPAKLPLPIGVSDYKELVTKYYHVDKTLMIKDFLDSIPKVSLFTRPRRFGKTLNMDMLRVFFEKTEEDTSVYFQNKKIWDCGQKYRDYQGQYPVIFISFKDVKKDSWESTLNRIAEIITIEYKRHPELATSEKIQDTNYYNNVVSETADKNIFESSLYMLSKMLHEHHGVAPIIIIDEYDIPIQQGYMKGYYDEIILFMRNLFSGCLKDNKHLSYGFLTGILRVAKESIFSGLNNLVINSVLDKKYSAYFGFTSDEVREMTQYYNATDKYNELCEWYDGYRFGETDIFNPWSVINYFANECEPRAFWISTGSNDIIGDVIAQADDEIYEKLTSLVNGKTFTTYIDTALFIRKLKSIRQQFTVFY